ncbi:hypothetical protein IT408_04215 [Candidatus Uhrbacteria bacterium]|nr:hypothetical protein [Candidatus Uhrbacteria bacterium]
MIGLKPPLISAGITGNEPSTQKQKRQRKMPITPNKPPLSPIQERSTKKVETPIPAEVVTATPMLPPSPPQQQPLTSLTADKTLTDSARRRMEELAADKAAAEAKDSSSDTPPTNATEKVSDSVSEEKAKRRKIASIVLSSLLFTIIGMYVIHCKNQTTTDTMSSISSSSNASAPSASVTTDRKPKAATQTKVSPNKHDTCQKVTQSWIDKQPWAAKRTGNSIKNFTIHNWPKKLNCGPKNKKLIWIDMHSVDITNCCHTDNK